LFQVLKKDIVQLVESITSRLKISRFLLKDCDKNSPKSLA